MKQSVLTSRQAFDGCGQVSKIRISAVVSVTMWNFIYYLYKLQNA